MIFLQVFLGILAALFVVRLAVGFRLRRMGFHRGHHGHHGHHRGGMRWWRVVRQLGLSREQRGQLRDLFRELRGGMGDLRGELPQELARLLGTDGFDRVSAERLADERLAIIVRMKERALDALARVHAILTPEQRAKLAAAVA